MEKIRTMKLLTFPDTIAQIIVDLDMFENVKINEKFF